MEAGIGGVQKMLNDIAKGLQKEEVGFQKRS